MSAPAPDRTLAFLHAHGLAVRPERLNSMVEEAVSRLRPGLYPPDPRGDLTAGEEALLRQGGFDLRPLSARNEGALARTAAKYAALLETGLTTSQAAARLEVDPSRVRQRLLDRTLYGVRTGAGWRIPAFQFEGERLLPGLGRVVAALAPHLHPVAVFNWFTLPHPDLVVEELDRPVSPREWLAAGLPAEAVVDLARDM